MKTRQIEDFDWIEEAEKKHQQDVIKMQTSEYIIEAFPEGQEIIAQKLNDLWEESIKLYKKLKEIRAIVDKSQVDTFSKWFYLNKLKYTEGKKLEQLRFDINRLTRLKIIYEKKAAQKHLSKEYFKTIKEKERFDLDKMFAREKLLEDIISFEGRQLLIKNSLSSCLCPFHNEKTASFFVYPGNWYHCFGCGAHGNFLDYLMKTRNLTFRQALVEANQFL